MSLQVSAFKEVPSPDLSQLTPPESFSSESFDSNPTSFFPDQAQTQDGFQGTFKEQVGEFEAKLGQLEAEPKTGPSEALETKHEKVVEEAEKVEDVSSSMKQDFDANFNPGFGSFGNFGGQSYASILWGKKRGE